MSSLSQELRARALEYGTEPKPIEVPIDTAHNKRERFALETYLISDFFSRFMELYKEALGAHIEERKYFYKERKIKLDTYEDVKKYMEKEFRFPGAGWDDFLVGITSFVNPKIDTSYFSRDVREYIMAGFRTMLRTTNDLFIETIPHQPIDLALVKEKIIQRLGLLATQELSQFSHIKDSLKGRLLEASNREVKDLAGTKPPESERLGCPALYSGFFKEIISIYLDEYLIPVFLFYSKDIKK